MTKNFTATNAAIPDTNPGQAITIQTSIVANSAADASSTFYVYWFMSGPNGFAQNGTWGQQNLTTTPTVLAQNYTLPANAPVGAYTLYVSIQDPSSGWAWQTVTQNTLHFNSPARMKLYGTYSPVLTLLKPAGAGEALDGVGFLPDSGDTWVKIDSASDEFAGTSIDLTKWRTRLPGGWDHYNDELNRYVDSGITVGNGSCKLTAKARPYDPAAPGHAPSPTGFNYPFFDSGCISSHTLLRYGYFEARMKFPSGLGVWPAFWLLPNTNYQGEIDIVEFVNNNGTEHQNMIHNNNLCNWPGNLVYFADVNYNTQYGVWIAPSPLSPTYFVDDWHTVSCYWNELDNTTTIYIDGFPVSQRRLGPAGQPSAVIFNMAMGGGWPTTNANGQAWTQPISLTDQAFEISHFRVFQKTGKILTSQV